MKIVLSLTIIFFFGRTFAQTQQGSDLLLLAGDDTATVNRLNNQAIELYSSHPEKTEIYGNRALQMAESLRYIHPNHSIIRLV